MPYSPINENPLPNKPVGFVVRHPQSHSCVITIPIPSKPYGLPYDCPSCNIKHDVKTIHLNLDDRGEALVSHGVLEDLRSVGGGGLTEEGAVENPPPLVFGNGMSRAQVDQGNRRIQVRNIHG